VLTVVLLFSLVLLLFALLADYLAERVAQLSERVAPMMILMTFLQTATMLLDVPLSWPRVLRDLFKLLSIVNLNIELARPECVFDITFKTRQVLTLASPVVLVVFTKVFFLVQALRITVGHLWTRRRHASSIAAADDGAREDAAPTLKQKIRAKARRLRKQLRGVFTAAFVVTSIFFLRTMVGGLDCSTVGYGEDAKLFMDREPATECNIDDPYYASVWRLSIIGLVCYALLFVALVVAMAVGGRHKFSFLADKMKPKWFWWELMLLLRKVLIMVVALRTSEQPEQGWFLCSFVLVLAISAHSFARPYKEDWLNACEYCSLFSTLLLFQAGMVFKVQSSDMDGAERGVERTAELASAVADASEAGAEEEALAPMARGLVGMSIGLILLTAAMCLYVELRVLCRCCRCKAGRLPGVSKSLCCPTRVTAYRTEVQTIKPEPDANPDASLDTWLVSLEAVLQQAAVDLEFANTVQRRVSDAKIGEDTRARALMSVQGMMDASELVPLRESEPDLEAELEPPLDPQLQQGPRREPQSEDAISTEHAQAS